MKRILNIILILIAVSGLLYGETYSLKQIMELVESNSKELNMARTERKLAAVQENLARSAIFPMIAGNVNYTRNFLGIEQPVPVRSISGGGPLVYQDMVVNNDNDFSFGVSLQQKIFDMKVFRALEASQQYRTLTGSVYEATRQGITTASKKTFYQVLLLQEVYLVKKATEQNAYDNYLVVKNKYENELVSELDMLQAEVNWKIKIPDSTQAEKNYNLALSHLKHMAGIKLEEDILLQGSLLEYPELPATKNLSEILASRPDYQALINEKILREINVEAKMSEFYPSLSASLTYGWQKSDDGFDLGEGTKVLSAGLSLTIPVFYGGSRLALLEKAKLELNITNTTVLNKEEDVQIQINNIFLTLKEARGRIDSADTTLKVAKKVYSLSETSVNNGLATQLDLKDASLNLEGAQLNYYAAIFDYLNAYFDWQQATGIGNALL